MNTRKFAPEDHSLVTQWFAAYGWPAPPLDLLPALGLIAYDETQAYACGWLYRTDSTLCLLEWVVADKTCDAEKRSLAIDLVMETLSKKAEQDGFRCIFASIKNESLRQRYENLGFVTTDTGITNLLRRIF